MAMQYTISYYSDAVAEQVLDLPKTLLARYFALTDRMMLLGSNLGDPHSKAIGGGLFELRLKGADGIARVFYCTLAGQRIVVLHGFVKKTQKTPAKELTIAHKRMMEVKNENT